MGKNKTYNKAIEFRISHVIKLIIVQETQYRVFGNIAQCFDSTYNSRLFTLNEVIQTIIKYKNSTNNKCLI